MHKKYTLPLSIFVVFENVNTVIWTSEGFTPNSYFMYINNSWIYPINLFFKNEVFFANSTLLENSAVDNKKFIKVNPKVDMFFKKSRLTLFYLYYFFSSGVKLNLLTSYNNKQLPKIASIDKIFKSASWLERETNEMFKVNYMYKTDVRRLLLDYTKQEYPLLKDFPTEGFNDVYYNFFEDQVIYTTNTVVEL